MSKNGSYQFSKMGAHSTYQKSLGELDKRAYPRLDWRADSLLKLVFKWHMIDSRKSTFNLKSCFSFVISVLLWCNLLVCETVRRREKIIAQPNFNLFKTVCQYNIQLIGIGGPINTYLSVRFQTYLNWRFGQKPSHYRLLVIRIVCDDDVRQYFMLVFQFLVARVCLLSLFKVRVCQARKWYTEFKTKWMTKLVLMLAIGLLNQFCLFIFICNWELI